MNNTLSLILISIVLCGCESSRSISMHPGNSNFMYNSELSQMDVITNISEGDVKDTGGGITIEKSSRVILIQSGQASPDASAVNGLSDDLDLLNFSGIPGRVAGNWRQAAKNGGVKNIIVYWGDIETGYKSMNCESDRRWNTGVYANRI